MFIRDISNQTLADVRDTLDEGGETLSLLSAEIEVNLTGDNPSIKLKDREVPVSPRGLRALAGRYDVPHKFLERQEIDLQETILTTVMDRNPLANAVVVNDTGILDVRPQDVPQVDLRRIVDVASHILTPDAQVIDFWREPGREFRLDVIAAEGDERGWGGDRKVGDLTGAGLRFGQDLRQTGQFHSPSVSLLMHRLVCTNGMEAWDEAARLDARGGSSVDEVLAELEALAERLFSRAEDKINAFYDLRTIKVADPAQRIVRMAEEAKLADKLIVEMVGRLPEVTSEDGTFTEFDLVNLITNEANNPLVKRDNARRQLHRLGGGLVEDHTARCTHCQTRLTGV